MFQEERHKIILKLLDENKTVKVNELSKYFKISEDSIRRDLRSLENKNLLQRTHGGAILTDKTIPNYNYSQRLDINILNKKKIAKKAVSLISENDVILLDGSTTVFQMISYLKEFNNLTIITNSIEIIYNLKNINTNHKIHILGGKINYNDMTTCDITTINQLEDIHTDKSFISPCSLSSDLIMYETSIERSTLKKTIIKNANKVICLIEKSKIGYTSFSKISPLLTSFTVISDIEDNSLNQFTKIIKNGLNFINI